MSDSITHKPIRIPWNKGKIIGQKPPLKRNEIWAIQSWRAPSGTWVLNWMTPCLSQNALKFDSGQGSGCLWSLSAQYRKSVAM